MATPQLLILVPFTLNFLQSSAVLWWHRGLHASLWTLLFTVLFFSVCYKISNSKDVVVSHYFIVVSLLCKLCSLNVAIWNDYHPIRILSKEAMHLSNMWNKISYEIHDKKLVIVDSFQELCHFVKGAAFPMIVYIYHKNLEYCMSFRVLNRHKA